MKDLALTLLFFAWKCPLSRSDRLPPQLALPKLPRLMYAPPAPQLPTTSPHLCIPETPPTRREPASPSPHSFLFPSEIPLPDALRLLALLCPHVIGQLQVLPVRLPGVSAVHTLCCLLSERPWPPV